MKKVWSIVINGKNDQIVMDDAEAMIIKMKFMPNIEMYDLTTLHNIKPEHLHKVNRKEALNGDIHLLWIKNAIEMKSLGGDPINGGVKENWSFEGLMQNKG